MAFYMKSGVFALCLCRLIGRRDRLVVKTIGSLQSRRLSSIKIGTRRPQRPLGLNARLYRCCLQTTTIEQLPKVKTEVLIVDY